MALAATKGNKTANELAAVIDWYSRYVICWQLPNTLGGLFCLDMLNDSLHQGSPAVFNTDQSVQFTRSCPRC